jgi:hypothetical protein
MQNRFIGKISLTANGRRCLRQPSPLFSFESDNSCEGFLLSCKNKIEHIDLITRMVSSPSVPDPMESLISDKQLLAVRWVVVCFLCYPCWPEVSRGPHGHNHISIRVRVLINSLN